MTVNGVEEERPSNVSSGSALLLISRPNCFVFRRQMKLFSTSLEVLPALFCRQASFRFLLSTTSVPLACAETCSQLFVKEASQ